MEAQGPEAKRPRLDTYNDGSHRGPQYTSIAPSHGHSPYSLPPRNHYPPSAQPPPPSPYYEAGIPEHSRALPDPTGYTHSQSGHNTPAREQRQYAPEASYSSRGGTSGTTRSPDSYQHYASARPLNSNAGTNDGHYPPATYATDSAGHAVGYPNHDGSMNGTPHHGIPMSAYPEHPPTLPPGRPEYSQSPVSATPHQYSGIPYAPQSNYQMMQRSRKGNRATQACDICRQRKAKCDEGRPKCSFCVENNMACNYQNVAPAKADRANQAIMDHLGSQDIHLAQQDERLEGLNQKFETFQHSFMQNMERMERIEKLLLNSSSPQASVGLPNLEGQERKSFSRPSYTLDSPKGKMTPDQKPPPPALPQVVGSREPKIEASPSGSHATASTDAATTDSSMPAMLPYERVEHTTAAHRLLSWPSIRRLVQKQPTLRKIAANEDYVMQQEEFRGTLRVYGVGEGRDYGDGGEPGQNSPAPHSSHNSSQHSGSPSSGRGDEGSDMPSPNTASTPPEGIWGYGFIPPVTTPSPPYSANELNFDFSLNIHPMTLRRLLDSYLDNFHVMHPFLDKVRLTRMIERFSARYNNNPAEQKLTKSLFSPPPNSVGVDVLRGASTVGKRKMSEGYTQSFATDSAYASGSNRREILFERSISTAIVLLVMALGRICEWKDNLPGVPREAKYEARRNPALGSQYHSPINSSTQSPPPHALHMSPPLSARTVAGTSAPSPANLYRNSLPSPRSQAEDPAIQARNVDIIPGLSYYAPATDILGNLHGSNDLAHVQAFLLAGLFTGQLARPWESFNWISSACIACRFLVRDPHLRKEKDPRKNMIKFAFWTCLQLESDILAELDLPRSGIQDITDVKYPNDAKPGDYHHWDSDKKIMGYYSGQIHIRNTLNTIQNDLYAPANLERATRGFALRNAFVAGLAEWRSALPPELKWADDEPLATHINDARLRAKYYGAKYIIHRPFLRYALDHEIVFDSDTQNAVSQALDRKNSVMLPPHTAAQTQKSEILESCKECVEAAMQSTEAFDGILQKRRLIVTNIFGTAHAQFGNIVVLATTHMARSPTLSSLVPAETLSQLFDRTISFLRSLAPLSDTLGRDALILEGLRQLAFESTGPTQPFSSMDS